MKRTRREHRAVTLIETVVALTVTGILLTAVGSSLLLASSALPERESPLKAPLAASEVVGDIMTELLTAVAVTGRTETSVTFEVADRDADAVKETLRYGWSGAMDGPLTRRLNTGNVVAILPHIHEFSLSYTVRSTTVDAVTVHRLETVRVVLNATADPATRIESSARLLNEPEVASP